MATLRHDGNVTNASSRTLKIVYKMRSNFPSFSQHKLALLKHSKTDPLKSKLSHRRLSRTHNLIQGNVVHRCDCRSRHRGLWCRRLPHRCSPRNLKHLQHQHLPIDRRLALHSSLHRGHVHQPNVREQLGLHRSSALRSIF